MIPTTLSLRTLEQLKKYLKDNKLNHLTLLPFFSMVDRRKKMHNEIMRDITDIYPDTLKSVIPYASDVERMGWERQPLGAYMGRGRSIDAYRNLWNEVWLAMNA